MTRRVPLIFWIVLLSFLIRLAFILWVPPTTISLEGDDAGQYQEAAQQISEYFRKGGFLLKELFTGHLFKGEGILEKYGLEIPWGAIKKSPFYPVFVGFLFSIAGPSPFWVFLAQAFLISLVSALFCEIGKELGQERVGLLSAFLFGIYPPFTFIVHKLLQENAAIFLFPFFYFVFFRARKTNSPWLFAASGFVLLFLALTKSRLSFFPFFLFLAMGSAWLLRRAKDIPVRKLLLVVFSFLIPYFLWAGVVSCQLHKPAVFLERSGVEVLSGVLPDYDGWIPERWQGGSPGPEVAQVLSREGILKTAEEKEGRVWPPDSRMIGAGFQILWKHPWISLQMGLERFERLWGRPYEWPWGEYLFPPEPLRWWHRFLAVMAIMGLVLWGLERPLAVWFLAMPLVYGVVTHSLFHCEHRFVLPFVPFFFPFASFFLCFLWRQRKVLLGSFQKSILGLGLVLGGGVIFHLSQPASILKFLPAWDAYHAYLWGAGIRSLVVIGFFLLAAIWLKPALPKNHLLASLGVTAFFILIPFVSNAFTATDWRSWKTTIRKPGAEIRQQIFLPRGSLSESVAQNLRLDLLPPEEGRAWVIRVNGEAIGTLETLKENPSPFFLIPPYNVYLHDAKKKPHRVRQWFSLPLPPHLLKEEAFNSIEIVFHEEDSEGTSPSVREWTLFGDYPVSSSSPEFHGPLFHRTSIETSVFKFWYDGDFRLDGITPLHHQGVKSSSPRGEYRIRIEVKDREGRFFVY